MATSVPNNLLRLLSEHTFEVDVNFISEDLTCIVCGKLMNDAYQSSCGCKYCRQCIVNYLANGNSYCQGGKVECHDDILFLDENVSRNSMLNKKILSVRVHCMNTWCASICLLDQMDEHLNMCCQVPLDCPYITIGCEKERAPTERTEVHLQNWMLPHTRLLMEAFNNLKNEFLSLKEELQMGKLEIASLREQSSLNENQGQVSDLVEQLVAIRGSIECEREELIRVNVAVGAMKEKIKSARDESNDYKHEMERLKREITTDKGYVKKCRNDMETVKKEINHVREGSKNIKNDVENLMKERKAAKEELRKIRNEMVVLSNGASKPRDQSKERLEPMSLQKFNTATTINESGFSNSNKEMKKFDDLKIMVDSLNIGTNKTVAIGQLWFTVDKFSKRKRDVNADVFSPYFYSHTNGYKMRLKVNPGGFNEGKGTHLSVYSVIGKGEYDDLLPWPCRHTITMSIIDQNTGEAYQSVTNTYCRIMKESSIKPSNVDNISRGWPTFISYLELRGVIGLIVNDSVLLRVDVLPPPTNIISFTVDSYRIKMALNDAVFSPYFYTHTNGYKLRLQLFPGGNLFCKGTALSLYAVICKGPNDDMLPWPCKHIIYISLINQVTKEPYETQTISYSITNSKHFNKPTKTDNMPYGWPSFVSHVDLRFIDGLIVNDSVLIHVALISPP